MHTIYEALRADRPGELARVAEAPTGTSLPEGRSAEMAERHSFAHSKQERPADAEISFVREGALGGGRRHFTPEAKVLLREDGYAEPIRVLGYEFGNHVADTP